MKNLKDALCNDVKWMAIHRFDNTVYYHIWSHVDAMKQNVRARYSDQIYMSMLNEFRQRGLF